MIGHDWGADAAWALALFRPDRVRAVATLSVPYTPRQSKGSLLSIVERSLGDGWYMSQFQVRTPCQCSRSEQTLIKKNKKI